MDRYRIWLAGQLSDSLTFGSSPLVRMLKSKRDFMMIRTLTGLLAATITFFTTAVVCFSARGAIRLVLWLVIIFGCVSSAQAQMCGTFGIKIFVIDESGKSVKDVAIGFN